VQQQLLVWVVCGMNFLVYQFGVQDYDDSALGEQKILGIRPCGATRTRACSLITI